MLKEVQHDGRACHCELQDNFGNPENLEKIAIQKLQNMGNLLKPQY
jgi:hypothetical protein